MGRRLGLGLGVGFGQRRLFLRRRPLALAGKTTAKTGCGGVQWSGRAGGGGVAASRLAADGGRPAVGGAARRRPRVAREAAGEAEAREKRKAILHCQ